MALLKKIRILGSMIKVLRKLLVLVSCQKGYDKFALAIRKRESSNCYSSINTYKYLGAYQFGMARLCDLGYTIRIGGGYGNSAFKWKTGYSRKYFLNNPELQDEIFKKHCKDLINRINDNYLQYIGTNVHGIDITLSGLVAGAHLGGIGGVGSFLIYSVDSHDQLTTRVSDYIKEFKGYDLTNIWT